MSAEHLNNSEVAGAARGDLPPTELLRASDHLAQCAACRKRVREMAALRLRSGAETEVTYELLADFLDDRLDPLRKQEVAEKIRNSPRAAADLANLARFRDETNRLTSKGSFPRWILPLAALFLLGLGAWWWSATQRDQLVSRSTLAALPADLRAQVLIVEQSGHLPISAQISALAGARERLAGAPNGAPGFRIVRPKATAILETRPRFEWTARAEASSYRVLVVEMKSGEVVARGESKGTSWQPESALVPGENYQWQVEALRGAEVLERVPRPPEPEARFTILSTQAQSDFEKIRVLSHDSRLVVAVAAARDGLLEIAAEELRALTKEKPDAALPRQLLTDLAHSRPITTNGAQ